MNFVLVPEEPTPEMKDAAWRCWYRGNVNAEDYYRAMLAASPTPSPVPADVHVSLGHLYGIADAIEEAHPWKAGDIRQHANAITRALSAPVQSCVTPLAGKAGAVEVLRAALEPFAREADEWADTVPDDHRSLCTEPGYQTANPGSETAFTVGDLRRARAVYDTSLTPPKAEIETGAERERLVADNKRLREENARLSKVEYFWDYNDPETGYGDWADALDEPPLGEVVHLLCGATLPPIWVTTRVLTVDDDGDADETERVSFDNEQEATACWDASLAAARAARAARAALSTETVR